MILLPWTESYARFSILQTVPALIRSRACSDSHNPFIRKCKSGADCWPSEEGVKILPCFHIMNLGDKGLRFLFGKYKRKRTFGGKGPLGVVARRVPGAE